MYLCCSYWLWSALFGWPALVHRHRKILKLRRKDAVKIYVKQWDIIARSIRSKQFFAWKLIWAKLVTANDRVRNGWISFKAISLILAFSKHSSIQPSIRQPSYSLCEWSECSRLHGLRQWCWLEQSAREQTQLWCKTITIDWGVLWQKLQLDHIDQVLSRLSVYGCCEKVRARISPRSIVDVRWKRTKKKVQSSLW